MTDEAAFYPIPKTADDATRALIERVNELKLPPLETLSPDTARREYRARAARSNFPSEPVGDVRDITVPAHGRTIPARIYRPEGTAATMPMLFYFHGGGFVIGDLDTHDPICRRICREAGAIVLAVDYRLAPEHPFPAAIEDALAVYEAIAPTATELGADPARIWVGGDSAGGNLAAILAQRTGQVPEPAGQILVYPWLDHVGAYASHAEFTETFPLTTAVLAYFDRHYFQGDADKASPLASPGHQQMAAPMPPALILAAEFDPLRDEAAAYADALANRGTSVRYHCYSGTIHGFLDKGRLLPVAAEAVAAISAAIREGLKAT